MGPAEQECQASGTKPKREQSQWQWTLHKSGLDPLLAGPPGLAASSPHEASLKNRQGWPQGLWTTKKKHLPKSLLQIVSLGNLRAASVILNVLVKWSERSEVAQSCPTLCDPVDYSLPGSSVHGILQARILEWVAISFSRGSSRSRDQNQVSRIADRFFTDWATREVRW